MKNNNSAILFLIAICSLLSWPLALAQQYDTLCSYPNLPIPIENEPGIADTIEIDQDIIIEDINFYIGITTFSHLPSELIITVTSPWGEEVTLQNHNLEPQFPCWIDTEAEEDGPGDLDDYIGYNARGQWVMYIVRYADYYPLVWESWRIEVVGEPLVGIKDESRPLVTGLDANYPNPFNSATVIHFTVAQPEEVSFAVYDILGDLVRDFEAVAYKPGHYQLKWDGATATDEPVSSGLYFLKMAVDSAGKRQTFTRKLTLLR